MPRLESKRTFQAVSNQAAGSSSLCQSTATANMACVGDLFRKQSDSDQVMGSPSYDGAAPSYLTGLTIMRTLRKGGSCGRDSPT